MARNTAIYAGRMTTSYKPPTLITLTPVDFSLTAGTILPSPQTPISSEPPTSHGGPLTSHPSTPERKIPGAYPSSDTDSDIDIVVKDTEMDRNISSPATFDSPPPPQQLRRKPSGVRRMFSMSNLRTSFQSSRTSLALPRMSMDRPSTSTNNRPFDAPSVVSSNESSGMQTGPTLRRKRSLGGGWLRRTSSIFRMNSFDDDVRGGKRMRAVYSLPVLPEISELGGGSVGDLSDLGFDADSFTSA